MNDYSEIIKSNLDKLKSALSEYFEPDKAFIKISLNSLQKNIFSAEFELKFVKPQNSLRKFLLDSYEFYIIKIDSYGFVYNDEYYTFENLDLFLAKISSQIS